MKNIKSLDMFENEGGMDKFDSIERLREILDEIIELMSEADNLVRDSAAQVDDMIIYERWRSYPKGNIMAMLDGGNRYDTTMSDIIEELQRASKGELDY
jgi:hypothetical protein